jgi:hypothetical protein
MEVCNLKKTPCRHCSMETYNHVKRIGCIADKNLKKNVEKIPLGLYCNNVGKWIEKMKDCPVDTCIKLYQITPEEHAMNARALKKHLKKCGADVSNLQ